MTRRGRRLGFALALTLVAGSAAAEPGLRRWSEPVAGPSRLARVTLTCPDDLVVECDGDGNVFERDAWLAGFEVRATGGCDPAELMLDVGGSLTPTLSFPDFADLSAWTLNGVTATIGNPVDNGTRRVLRLTNSLSQSGSAFVTDPVSLDRDASFSAYFTFRIGANQGAGDADGPGADGLVFVLQTVSATVGGTGGGLGYQGIMPSLGVEFDTYNNGTWDRNDGNHVGVDEDGDVTSRQLVPVARRLNDDAPWHAWVEYDGASDVLEVRVADDPTRPGLPLFSHAVDLPTLLGTTDAFVGFTSGTGAGGGEHDILSFFFTQGLVPFTCGGTGVEVVTASGTDACADSQTCTRMLTVVDTTPPALTASPIAYCQADAATAEAAALAATDVREACSLPVTLTVATTGTCDAVVTVTAEDACGNVATLDHLVRLDVTPPVFAPCPIEIVASATGPDGAVVPVGVGVSDGCDANPRVVNDRTDGGLDATDLYPCGLTRVTFLADDECGLTSTCEVFVRVEAPQPAVRVGAVLRVTRDAASQPVLDWTGAPAAPWYAVLRDDLVAGPRPAAPGGWGVAGPRWTDVSAAGRLLFYDVRTVRCDGGLSDD